MRLVARVKQDAKFINVTACSGRTYLKDKWDFVPQGMEQEAEDNPYLDVKEWVDEELVINTDDEFLKELSEAEKRTFINQLDWELYSKKDVKKEPVSRFNKPDKYEVYFYIQENGYSVNVEDWFNHYESNVWKVDKNPMKDWKAAVRTWEKGSNQNSLFNHQTYPSSKSTLACSASTLALSSCIAFACIAINSW